MAVGAASPFFAFPPYLGLDAQRPLSQPAEEVQRREHGAQPVKVGQLQPVGQRGGRDARRRAQAGQGARRQRRVRYLSRHHVRPGRPPPAAAAAAVGKIDGTCFQALRIPAKSFLLT